MALPLAAIGLGGALALVVLQGEQPGEGAEVEAVPGVSRPTLVSARRSTVAEPSVTGSVTAPPPSSSSVEVAPVEVEVREAVRSGPSSVTEVPEVLAAPEAAPESTVEERRQRGERSHRHRPTRTAPPVTTAPDSAPPPTVTPVTTPPAPTIEPVPPASEVPPSR
ncbi:hypothetical protein [Umezawaea sp. NPDC059074]|uniref:hypothetical protein n=1 Tax=Umezawaea sp. NPDC059074 TaxID=3346716 RepID=UPI0036CF2DC9